jgi:hypothetical protein
MKKLMVVIGVLLIVGLSAVSYAGVSVGFGLQFAPEPLLVPPPAYAYPYQPAYPYPVPAPYYPPPGYYSPRVYAAPPSAVFGFRFGFDGHGRHDRRFDRRWH